MKRFKGKLIKSPVTGEANELSFSNFQRKIRMFVSGFISSAAFGIVILIVLFISALQAVIYDR